MVKVPYVSVYDLGIALFDLPVTLIFFVIAITPA